MMTTKTLAVYIVRSFMEFNQGARVSAIRDTDAEEWVVVVDDAMWTMPVSDENDDTLFFRSGTRKDVILDAPVVDKVTGEVF